MVEDNSYPRRVTLTSGAQAITVGPFLHDDELKVTIFPASGAASYVGIDGTDYSLTGEGLEAGGTCTTIGLAVSDQVVIERNMQFFQETDLINASNFQEADVEQALDELTMLCQQLKAQVDRSLKLPLPDTPDDDNSLLALVAARASKALAFDSSGDIDLVTVNNVSASNAAGITYTPAGTGAEDTTVQAKLREFVSVTDFGATGDGATDDAAAIQEALDSLTGGGTCFVPKGTYVISTSLNYNYDRITMVGEGDASHIQYTGTTGYGIEMGKSDKSVEGSRLADILIEQTAGTGHTGSHDLATTADTGTDDTSSAHATIMTDSGAAFTNDTLIGYTIWNTTDGSKGTVTDNDGTTVTVASLAGGTTNTWNSGDGYTIGMSLVMTDSGSGFTVDDFKGYQLRNTTDGSQARIASNTSDAITLSEELTGGTNNYWTSGDNWIVMGKNGCVRMRSGNNVAGRIDRVHALPLQTHVGAVGIAMGEGDTLSNTAFMNSISYVDVDCFASQIGIYIPCVAGPITLMHPVVRGYNGYDDTDSIGLFVDQNTHAVSVVGGAIEGMYYNVKTGTSAGVRGLSLRGLYSESYGINSYIVDLSETTESPNIVGCTFREGTAGAPDTTGTHDGSGNAAILTDSTASFPVSSGGVGQLKGWTLTNVTDGSSAIVTDNTATTVTATLTGGTDDDWDASDAYNIENRSQHCIRLQHGCKYAMIMGNELKDFEQEPIKNENLITRGTSRYPDHQIIANSRQGGSGGTVDRALGVTTLISGDGHGETILDNLNKGLVVGANAADATCLLTLVSQTDRAAGMTLHDSSFVGSADGTVSLATTSDPILIPATGTDDTSSSHATIMTDSTALLVADTLIGFQIRNTTDGSEGTITDNDVTTITVGSLSGGTLNVWNSGDGYTVVATDPSDVVVEAASDSRRVILATNNTPALAVDQNATAAETRFLIYDVDNATLERVSVGAADSGGVGYKLLRIAN